MVAVITLLNRDAELYRPGSEVRSVECGRALGAGDARPGVTAGRIDMAEVARVFEVFRDVRLLTEDNDTRAFAGRELLRKEGLNSSTSSPVRWS
jgi:hypothetical protein